MISRLARYLLFASLCAVAACSSGAGAGGTHGSWRAAVDTVGDTVVVRTTSGSVWGDTTFLEPELTIGVFDGADYEMFGNIVALAVSDAGEIYVLDRQVPAVRMFGRDGAYLGDLGREGGGPGEYKRPASLAILPDGRILLRDRGNGRINVYTADGQSLPSWRLPSGGTFGTSRPMDVDTAGNTYTMVLLQVGVDVTEWTYGLARFTPDGEHTDTLRAPAWDFEPHQVVARREGSSSSTSVPFSPSVSWTLSPFGYFVGGLSTDYRIDLFRLDESVLRIERDWTPVPVVGAEKAEREREIVENFKRLAGSWKWNGPPIPDTKPPFRDIMVDDDGRLWVRVSQPGYEYLSEEEAREEERLSGRPQLRYRESVAFDLFDRDGRFLGPVRVPEDLQTYPEPIARGDTVWAVARDELDVARVVRYRMVRGRRERP